MDGYPIWAGPEGQYFRTGPQTTPLIVEEGGNKVTLLADRGRYRVILRPDGEPEQSERTGIDISGLLGMAETNLAKYGKFHPHPEYAKSALALVRAGNPVAASG